MNSKLRRVTATFFALWLAISAALVVHGLIDDHFNFVVFGALQTVSSVCMLLYIRAQPRQQVTARLVD